MATELAKAYVQIVPSAEGISGSISNILNNEASDAGSKAGNSFSSSMGNALKTGGKIAAASITAVAGAATALGGAMASGIKNTAEFGDNIDKMSQKMGLTAEAYQEWDFIMQHNGTSMETLKASMKTLANAAESGNDAFAKLGITEKEMAKMSQQELFENVITGLQNVDDSTERTYLAGKLLGRGATELGALLNMTAEDTEAMKQQLHDIGGVMSNDAVKASAAYQDSLQNLQTTIQGLSRGALSEFLPAVTSIMDGLTAIFSGDEGGLALVNDGVRNFIDHLTDILPSIMEMGASILTTLGEAIITNLPTLLESASRIIMQLGQGLIDNLPMILKTGLDIIVSLGKGIVENLPTLIPSIVDVVLQITESLIDNVDLLIDGAISLIIGLAEGLINALPKLIEKIPEIVIKMVDALIRNAPKLLEAAIQLMVSLANGIINAIPKALSAIGQLVQQLLDRIKGFWQNFKSIGGDLISGLWEGIKSVWNNLVDNVKNLASNLIGSVKGIFGIHSPSKVFANIGEMCVAGFDNAFDDFGEGAVDNVNNAMKELSSVDMATPQLTSNMAINTAQMRNSQTANASNDVYGLLSQYLPNMGGNTNVNVALQGDASNLFRVVRNEVNKFTKATGNSPFVIA